MGIPETALTRLGLAELLEHYPDELNVAIEHLDFAIAEFREMKMHAFTGAAATASRTAESVTRPPTMNR